MATKTETQEPTMTASMCISHDITIAEYDALDRETQIHTATYDDGEFRELATFRSVDTEGRVTYFTACEELLEGIWEGFVSLGR
jgi:hypothetical protein